MFRGRVSIESSEMIAVGEDYQLLFSNDDDPQKHILFYKGKHYSRDTAEDPWVREAELDRGADFGRSLKEALRGPVETQLEEMGDDVRPVRLPNELIDGRNSYHIVLSIDGPIDPAEGVDAIASELEANYGSPGRVPQIPLELLPNEISGETHWFYGIDDLGLNRLEMDMTGLRDGETVQTLRKTWELLDVGEPPTLPGPLPGD